MPDTITSEELERRCKHGLYGMTHSTKSEEAIAYKEDVQSAVEDAAHTIRALEQRVVELEELAVPDGCNFVAWDRDLDIHANVELVGSYDKEHEGKWYWKLSPPRTEMGYEPTMALAVKAAESAKEASHA